MKIFYAVQATGNGHISRAMELIPHLQRFGTVDIFLSGDNGHLEMDATVKYRSKGLSLHYNAAGSLDYWKILRSFHPLRLRKEINDILQLQLKDTQKAVFFRADLSNEKIPADGDKAIASQEAIYNYVKGLAG